MASPDRLRRLLLLLNVLQSGTTFNTLQLARECRVSRRTVFRDLRTLQESGIPVRFDKRRQGYTLGQAVYVPPTEFTLEEALSVAVLCNELSDAESGIPFQEAARTAALKLLSALPGRLRELVGELSENIDLSITARHPHGRANGVYRVLADAIAHRQQVRIRYRSLMTNEPDEFSTLLSPYRLLFGRRAWYVIGRSTIHRSVRTFHLGRISAAETVDSSYDIPNRFDLNRYFGNAWNLIRERGRRQKVVVRFQPMVAQNVADVRWHKTQQLNWNDDGTLDFTVIVDGLREIQWWVLGYGDQAEVLEPSELRDAIAYRASAMLRVYRNGKRKSPRRRDSDRKPRNN